MKKLIVLILLCCTGPLFCSEKITYECDSCGVITKKIIRAGNSYHNTDVMYLNKKWERRRLEDLCKECNEAIYDAIEKVKKDQYLKRLNKILKDKKGTLKHEN